MKPMLQRHLWCPTNATMRWWNPCVDGLRSFKISGPLHVFPILYTERKKKDNAKFISMSIKTFFNDFQTASQIHPTKELICGKCTITVSCISHTDRFAHVWCIKRTATFWKKQPVKTKISLGIRPVWLESSLTLRSMDSQEHKGFMRTAKALIILCGCPAWSESSLGAHFILLVLSCCCLNGNRCKICFSWTAFSCFK